MRILGWMHNKPRQTNSELFKDFTIGSYCSCLSAQPLHEGDHVFLKRPGLDSVYRSRLLKQPNDECEKTSLETDAAGRDYKDETSTVISELFHGFLAIGTLGSETTVSEPTTPTFPMSLGNLTEEKTEVTEKELKLINDELEKFLEAEAEEEGCNESLARSSYVSTVTLSGTLIDGATADDCGMTAVYPLQGYLFGSMIELPETGNELKKEKVSLGEMFRRTKVTDGNDAGKEGMRDMPTKLEHRSAKQLMKKILKKLHISSANPPGNDAINSVSTKKKLNKISKMFHRKVHPESSIAEKVLTKSRKENIKKTQHEGDYNAGHTHLDEENKRFLSDSNSMKGNKCFNKLKLPQYSHSGNNLTANREHWIKTDADYLVLEL